MKWQDAILVNGICNEFGFNAMNTGEEVEFSARDLQAMLDAAAATEREAWAVRFSATAALMRNAGLHDASGAHAFGAASAYDDVAAQMRSNV